MYDIGIVGLSSVHAETFAKVMWKYHDATVSMVWGEDTDPKTVEEYCSKWDARAVEDASEMIGDVDAVMIPANWDTHRAFATEFLENGVPTLVDKPIAGSISDVDAMVESSEEGETVLFGGSAIPFHAEVQDFSSHDSERTIHCASYRDPFYYGCHVVDTARKLTDSDWMTVETTPAPGRTIAIEFQNGSYATIRFDGPLSDAGFGIMDVSARTDATVIRSFSPTQPNSDQAERELTYRYYLDRFFGNIEGRYADDEWVADAAKLLVAAQAALKYDDAIQRDDERLHRLDMTEEDTVSGYMSTADT
jgi:hypothetical protein